MRLLGALAILTLTIPMARAVQQPNCPDGVAGGVVAVPAGSPTLQDLPKPKAEVPPPKPITRVAAEYPPDDKGLRTVAATVYLQGTIDVDGSVGDVQVLNCKASRGETVLAGDDKTTACTKLATSAQTAFEKWRYEPVELDGKKVCVYATAAFGFRPK